MLITEVRIRLVKKETMQKLRAIASVIFDGSFIVHDIRLMEGDEGLYMIMPGRRTLEGGYRDVAHPINSDTRTQIQSAILSEYYKLIDCRNG